MTPKKRVCSRSKARNTRSAQVASRMASLAPGWPICAGLTVVQNRGLYPQAPGRQSSSHNFKSTLWTHANPQRPGYAIGDEPGLLLCTWPRGGKPTLPFVYSDEVWTGIEYQAASHMISEGLVDEGLTVVKPCARATMAGAQPLERVRMRQLLRPRYGQLCVTFFALSGFRYSAQTHPDLRPATQL